MFSSEELKRILQESDVIKNVSIIKEAKLFANVYQTVLQGELVINERESFVVYIAVPEKWYSPHEVHPRLGPRRRHPLSGALSRGRRPARLLPPPAVLRRRGHRPCLPAGDPDRQGLRGQCPAARHAGGAPAVGGCRARSGDGPEVQFRRAGHRRRAGGRPARKNRRHPARAAERPRRQRRAGTRAGLSLPAQFPEPLGPAAVPAGPVKGHGLLSLRRQQGRAGRPALLGRDQRRQRWKFRSVIFS